MSVTPLPRPEQSGPPRPHWFTPENAITSSSRVVPEGVLVWRYLGREVLKCDGFERSLGISPEERRRWHHNGLIAPLREQNGQQCQLWDVTEVERVAAQRIDDRDERRQERYRQNHRRPRK